ncbi:MAG: gluconate 2-dehydrogenase subunit 3 family protein [Cyclobacteriaceae bacterium]
MNRREAISAVSLLLGGTIVGSGIFLESGCSSSPEHVGGLINQDQLDLLDEIAETILPKSDTPGAKEARVAEFMAVMVNDCYTKAEQKIFLDGLKKIDEECKRVNGKSFAEINSQERTAFLTQLDVEQKVYMENKKLEQATHYFRMMKELTLLGFFTSEVGATKVLRYIAVPGKYDGDVVYKKGDRAWAT